MNRQEQIQSELDRMIRLIAGIEEMRARNGFFLREIEAKGKELYAA